MAGEPSRAHFKHGLRFMLAMALLLAANHFAGERTIESLLPLMKREIAWLDDTYRVIDLKLDRQGADRVIRLEVGLANPVVLGGRVLLPDPRARANASTLAGSVMQPVVLCLALIAAWPARRPTEYPFRALIAFVGLVLAVLADVPFVLWGEVWHIQVSALEPDRFSPLLVWKDFLQGGGRFVLGLLVGALAIRAAPLVRGHHVFKRFRSRG